MISMVSKEGGGDVHMPQQLVEPLASKGPKDTHPK
jgi:hypothetical protein